MDTMDSDLIIKQKEMRRPRHNPIFIKVQDYEKGLMVYAIGGRADGFCERFELEKNKWEFILNHPQPMELVEFHGLNIVNHYIYLVGPYNNGNKGIKIWKLDIQI